MRSLSKIDFRIKDMLILTLICAPFYFVSKIFFYTSPDEYYYIFTAIQLAEGNPITIQLESPLLSGNFVPTTKPNVFISKYPIGQSLLIAIFYLIGGYPFIYYMNGVFAIFTVILTYFCVLEISKDRLCSLIGAFFLGLCPPMVFYSRTLFSDLTSATFLLLSFFFYLRASKKNEYLYFMISSLSLGFAVLLKLVNILFMLPFLLNQIRTRKLGELSIYLHYIPLIPFLSIIALYNSYFFGNFFVTGYQLTGEVFFNPLRLLINLPRYFLILNLFPPFGLITAFLYTRKKFGEDVHFISFFMILTFLVFYGGSYLRFDIEHLFIESSRYLLVILPYLCFNAVMWFSGFIKTKKVFYYFFLVLFITLGLMNIVMVSQYYSFKGRLVYYRDLFYTNTQPDSLIIGDATWDKLFHPYFSREYDERYYLRYSALTENEITGELLPFIENWITDKPVYFIDDPYVDSNIHDLVLQLLTERYQFNSIIATDQPYTVELFQMSQLSN
ncbi:glycosyltransferase family 39 protein [Candidatus Borrarchaeum sp.]|uniref:ArnT family glycosyltransferase n=1 Tax=Candidatus Borrarchaeum sp. TaxID=2846742 RepID=UPI00257DDDD2|nr:glycosyltransferase family 39 protein [Candidatus Borrarchaeum sp.]